LSARRWARNAVAAAPATAEPVIRDTKLLSHPAVSASNIAFVYADDLWVADLDGKNVRRLTTDPGLEQAVLPPGVAATGYRVVQEALTNVRKHAPDARAVEVDVRIREEALLVSVRNDGVSAAPASGRPGGGFGLVGMGERVAALDGTFTAGPTAPGVWTVSVRVPLRGAR
jgi:signal transduction histidine kinase